MTEDFAIIGKGVPKVDAVLKATGKAVYGADVSLPGMLHGKILRSTVPHAKILNIDASKALRLPGVRAVITGKDFPGLTYGFSAKYRDQTPLAMGKVRFVGQEIAAVAAIDEDLAEEALTHIDVEYEVLPAVLDPFEAMREDAPLVHDNKPKNICSETNISFGDVTEGFLQSDCVREDEFSTQAIKHGFIEPHGALGVWDASGKATIWANKQSPYVASRKLAMALGIKPSELRLVQTYIGGGFGSARSDPQALDFCSLMLSKKTGGQPVKIVYTMEDVLTMGEMRHPFFVRVKTGMLKDGTLKAMQVYVVADGGAFTSIGPISMNLASISTDLPYAIPNVKYDAVRVFTNKGYCGSLRGHGVPQVRWALGQQLDMMCRDLDLDMAEVSLKNAVRTGDVTPRGFRIDSCGLTECIEKAVEASGWKEKRGKLPPYRGIGMSAGSYFSGVRISGHNAASCIIRMNEDGTASVQTGATDIGQGCCTVIAMIVAEVLGLRMEDITINTGVDTDFTPVDPGTYGSRVTFFSGNAAKLAAEDARGQMAEVASQLLEVPPDEIIFKDRKVFAESNPENAWKIGALIRYIGQKVLIRDRTIWGRGNFDVDLGYMDFKTGKGNMSPSYAFGVDIVELEVDPETGKIKILNVVGAHDVGRVINLRGCEGQVDGAWVMCQGQFMFEDLKRDKTDGHVLNPSFMDYKLPTAMDVPLKRKHIFVESIDPHGPFGAKEAGEGPSVGILYAFGNALADATGARIHDLPITPEKVLRGVRQKEQAAS